MDVVHSDCSFVNDFSQKYSSFQVLGQRSFQHVAKRGLPSGPDGGIDDVIGHAVSPLFPSRQPMSGSSSNGFPCRLVSDLFQKIFCYNEDR